MSLKNILSTVKIILYKYKIFLNKFLYFLISAIFIVTSSFIITLPVWYTATKYSKIYTVVSVSLILLFLIYKIARNLKNWTEGKLKEGLSKKNIIMIPVRKTTIFLVFTAVFYLITLIYFKGFIIFAALSLVLYLLVLGYFIFIFRKRNEKYSS
jgi:hypothetical protein